MSDRRPSSLDLATSDAARSSAEAAGRCMLARDLAGATRAIGRAEKRLAELRAALPWHSRLVRKTEECVALARQAISAPLRQENDETGEIVPKRARLARRTIRARYRA